jgi:hypothetical protein
MTGQQKTGGRTRLVLLVVGGLGCLAAVLVVILAAVLIMALGVRTQAEIDMPVVVETVPERPARVSEERLYSMAVCAEERDIRVLSPGGPPPDFESLQVVPGERVGLVGAHHAPDAHALARYGWVAADASGGILRWWGPGDFDSFREAEPAIREILSFCEVCCASGTVVERESGGRTVWLQDPRFSLSDGGRVTGSFGAIVRSAPAGAAVQEDEMDGAPTIDLGGVTAYGALDDDVVVMLVAQLGQP